MDIVVTGIGLVTALGDRENTWQALLAGKTAIAPRQPFPELPPLPLAMIAEQPSDLLDLTQQVLVSALEDATLSPPLADCGVVIGSSRGNQSRWEAMARQWYGTQADPVLPELANWLESLPQAAATATAQLVKTSGPVLAPMAACATGLWAIAQGYELIQSGYCQRVVVGAVEAAITPLTITGFDRMGALAQTGAYPFAQQREGLVLGEGGAILVLETAELARQRSAKIYGRVLGFGLTADGYHVSAPNPGSHEGAIAIKQCLERSGLLPEQIDYIHAHGTATRLNDQNEAHLIQTLFPGEVAVSSTKGATGHTLGASGAIGVALCLLALYHQKLPPCTGMGQPAFPLNLIQSAQTALVRHALCLGFGFGGQNGAIAVGQFQK